MKSLLAFLLVTCHFQTILAETKANSEEEIILPSSLPQKVYTRYKTNFSYRHDRGFYLAATLGPQWNHSIKNPEAKAIRFGGKLGLGWFVSDGIVLHAAAWGNFLEQASLVAGGPGMAFLFDGPNIGLDFSVGVGRAFNAMNKEGYKDFAETVLATNISFGKYWWLSGNTNLGLTIFTGLHGFTLTTGEFNSVGWNIGLGMSFLVG